jgi:DNA-binding NarL/FixJ family response regulator
MLKHIPGRQYHLRHKFDILVTDHNDLLREKIAGILSRLDSVRVVAQTSDCNNFENIVFDIVPDLLVMDINSATAAGMTNGEELLKINPRMKVIITTEENDEEYPGAKNIQRNCCFIEKSKIIAEVQNALSEMAAEYENDEKDCIGIAGAPDVQE